MSDKDITEQDSGEEELREVRELVANALNQMGLQTEVDGRVDGRFLRLNVTGADAEALVTGTGAAANSHVLDALQLVAMRRQSEADTSRTVIIDAGGFREDRISELDAAAERIGDVVVHRGDTARIWGMNSFDRRAIHLALKERKNVRTDSEGDGVFRVLCVIGPSGDKATEKDKDRGKAKDRHRDTDRDKGAHPDDHDHSDD